MKQGLMTSVDWEYIGAVLANEEDDTQAKFFKSFVKEIKSWGTAHQGEFQLAKIGSNLTEEEKELLQNIIYS